MKFKYGELFAGPGGLALGAVISKVTTANENFEIKHVWANDYDKDSCNTYRENICPNDRKSVIQKDVRKLEFSKLENIDILSFGFPCNDFSVVGERKGFDGQYGPLYSFGIKAVRYFKPIVFIAENVGGLKNANEGKALKVILNDMFDSGYSVYPHLYKFEDYGVPQTRHRIIIIGIRNDIKANFRVPYNKIPIVSAKEAIENPPIPQNAPNHKRTIQSQQVIERLKYIKPGENAFTAEMPDNLRLKVKGAKISQIYKRLDPDKPSYTITGSGGGGTHVYHWKEHRALTNRERARLQTFPDDFIFIGSKESVRKQIGMAVPPKAAKLIFEAVIKTILDITYDSTDFNITPLINDKLTLNKNEYNIENKQFIMFDQLKDYFMEG